MRTLAENEKLKNDSKFLQFIDMVGEPDCTLTISDVSDPTGEIGYAGKPVEPGKFALHFKETPKAMIIGGPKLKFIIKQFGKKKQGIIGNKITVYADPNVKGRGGKVVGGLKFRGQE